MFKLNISARNSWGRFFSCLSSFKGCLLSGIAHDTKPWVMSAADERAARAGMVFDGERGQFVCDWIETHCHLWQGPEAGKPMKLIPYQREFLMRLYCWVYWSTDWNAWIRRFTKATLLCAKKNGKSPFLAANGLYLTCADNEPGNNVYNSAKNGKQAGRIQEHAVLMVDQSPKLDGRRGGDCVVNRTTFQITHKPTRSKLMILSGDDSRGWETNEGINGSIMIDELHVYDREMWERTSRAGRSRKEPLNLAVSTAGDDPSSYGFERTEYGRQVNSGARSDPHILHVEYAAPQRATDEEIAENLDEYIRAANPALGRTVRMGELRQDYEDSKDKPREMNRFKQYTLNIWIGSVAPWLNTHNWDRCQHPFTIERFSGEYCKTGVDLSRTRDMTSLVTSFVEESDEEDDPGILWLWPMFWIPRKTAEARKNLFPYLEWADQGYLTLTEGSVVDFGQIEREYCEQMEEYEIQVTDIFFDNKYAEEFTQRVADRLDANRTDVSQSLMALSPLAKEFERRIDGGWVRHPGNKVMDWQVGHVQVYTDRNQNIRPVKPDPNSGKCIDGIMATLDLILGVMEDTGSEGEPSIHF